MKALVLIFLVCSIPLIEATTPYYHAVQFGRTLRRMLIPRVPFGLKLLGLGKAALLAPITVPLHFAGKAVGAGIIAGPALVGASLGAPIGAVAGAHAGKEIYYLACAIPINSLFPYLQVPLQEQLKVQPLERVFLSPN